MMTQVADHLDLAAQTIPPTWAAKRQARRNPTNYLAFDRAEIDGSVVARFQRVATQMPQQIALHSASSTLTYRELDLLSNRIAQAILAAAGDEALVVLLFEHGAEPIVALMGVLKAGYGYVALDTSLPESTQRDYLQDSLAQVVVTTNRHVAAARQICTAAHTIIEYEAAIADTALTDLSPRPIDGHSLSCILYTSGSTGKPKGVERTHAATLYDAWLYTSFLKISALDRMAMLFNWSYGLGQRLILTALLNGVTLYPLVVESIHTCLEWVVQNRITLLPIAISLFRSLANEDCPAQFQLGETVEWIFIGGQIVLWEEVNQFIERHQCSHTLFHYSFGSSECGSMVHHFVQHPLPEKAGRIPLGYPSPDKEILILDEAQQPVPQGELGEIGVQSRYISSGYWQQPELTADKFRARAGATLFLSGDLGRFNAQGILEFVGRADHMIKIRGYRVELSAVELALRQLACVTEVAVIAPEQPNGERRLVAYVTTTQPRPTLSDLRQQLSQQLPTYAIPSQFVFIDAFPLTISGKIDRTALPKPDHNRPTLETPFTLPSSDLEHALAAIWTDVLGISPIGIHDNFFDLGGDSLLTLRLLRQIEASLQQTISLPHFMANPTIAQIAPQLTATADHNPAATDAPTPLIDAQLQAIYDEISRPGGLSALYLQTTNAKHPVSSRLGRMLNRLPYRMRLSVLHWLVCQPWAQQRFWPQQTQLIRRFYTVLNTPVAEAAVIANSLFYGLQNHYRLHATLFKTTPRAQLLARFIQVEGGEKLSQAKEHAQGVILTWMHTVAADWFRQLQWVDYMIGNFAGVLKEAHLDRPEVEALLRARQVQVGQQSLQKGLVVGLVPDGYLGDSAGVVRSFHGRQRVFFTGFAELALLTGAPIHLAQAAMQPGEKVHFRLLAPFDSGGAAMSHTARVDHLMAQYLTQLDHLWRTMPWMIPWQQMEKHLACPIVSSV